MFSSEMRTKTVKEESATKTGAQVQRKVAKAFSRAAFFRLPISFSLMSRICSPRRAPRRTA